VPIQQQEYATWGLIPGALQYSWLRSYVPYQFSYAPTPGAPLIALKTVGQYNFDVERTFEEAQWYPQKSVVAYSTNYTVSELTDDSSIYTVNLASYNVWYQMTNKPQYFKAWQAMAQAYEVIINSDYVERLYAYNALSYFFNDYADVQAYVLPTLTPADQNTVYTDPNYGMNSVTGLSKWCKAADVTSGTPSSKTPY